MAGNGVQHARANSSLHLSLTRDQLHIAVHDPAPVSDQRLDAMRALPGPGFGLRLVAGFATQWGVTRQAAGKSIWARLTLPKG